MIIILNKAVLHILDFDSGITVLSEKELDIHDNSVITYITKHVEKFLNNSNAETGVFCKNSIFCKNLLDYTDGNLDFMEFSYYIANIIHSETSKSDILDPTDLIIADLSVDNKPYLVIFKCNNKIGFTHYVNKDDGRIKNELINYYTILPNISQKIDEYAIVETNSLYIKFNDKKRFIDGKDTFIIPEKLLECTSSISPKHAIDLVQSITRTVSENHGQSSVAAISKVKSYLVENAEISDFLDPVELGKEVFSSSSAMQEEYINEVKNAGIPNTVKVDRSFAIKNSKNHRIKTDTGIELAFPVDYFQNKDYIEFTNNPDGTILIQLKNIGKIINK